MVCRVNFAKGTIIVGLPPGNAIGCQKGRRSELLNLSVGFKTGFAGKGPRLPLFGGSWVDK
jgi:hypothetical protein